MCSFLLTLRVFMCFPLPERNPFQKEKHFLFTRSYYLFLYAEIKKQCILLFPKLTQYSFRIRICDLDFFWELRIFLAKKNLQDARLETWNPPSAMSFFWFLMGCLTFASFSLFHRYFSNSREEIDKKRWAFFCELR